MSLITYQVPQRRICTYPLPGVKAVTIPENFLQFSRLFLFNIIQVNIRLCGKLCFQLVICTHSNISNSMWNCTLFSRYLRMHEAGLLLNWSGANLYNFFFFYSYCKSCLFLMSFPSNLASGSDLVWDWPWIVLFTPHGLWCGEQVVPGFLNSFKEVSGQESSVKSWGKY